MPVLLVPLLLVGAAMLSALLLYQYERTFGSPLRGLAQAVPFIGGWIASGVDYAISYGSNHLQAWLDSALDSLVGWLNGLHDIFTNFPAAVDAFLHDLVDGVDHLTHVTSHEIVKSFVNPVRDIARGAEHDAATALTKIDALDRALAGVFNEVEGDIAKVKHDVLHAIEQVDLPNLHGVIGGEVAAAVGAVAGDLDALHDWAGGWIDQLLHDFQSIPLPDLIALLSSVPALALLVNTIAKESGLDGEGCRRKVKGICGTDPGGWGQLLGLVTPLIAFPGLVELVKVAQGTMELVLPAVEQITGTRK